MSAVDRMPTYRPFDQGRHLGDPPWRPDDPAVQAWEDAHGHDVRLKCLPEFSCMAIEYENDALREVADSARKLDVIDMGEHGVAVVGIDEVRAALARLDGEVTT